MVGAAERAPRPRRRRWDKHDCCRDSRLLVKYFLRTVFTVRSTELPGDTSTVAYSFLHSGKPSKNSTSCSAQNHRLKDTVDRPLYSVFGRLGFNKIPTPSTHGLRPIGAVRLFLPAPVPSLVPPTTPRFKRFRGFHAALAGWPSLPRPLRAYQAYPERSLWARLPISPARSYCQI